MTYKKGDVVLVKFPFTTLLKAKKRPVLVIKSENEYGDFVCFQITSKKTQSNLYPIDSVDIMDGKLQLQSYVKYDKCFTLNSELVDKKLLSVNEILMENKVLKINNLIEGDSKCRVLKNEYW